MDTNKHNRIIELKLACGLTAPSKRMFADLDKLANDCNEARNVMTRAWERWREDHPEFVPPQVIKKDGTLVSPRPAQQYSPSPPA